MNFISISNDIVPIGKFKASISKWFKSVQNSRRHLVITQNGKPAGVLISPSEYDELMYKKAFLDSVGRGVSDSDSGRIFTVNELKSELSRSRKQR